MSELVVRKINRALCIVEDGTGRVVYVHPGFLDPVRDRDVLRTLAADMARAENPIVPVIAHETAHNPRVRRARRAGFLDATEAPSPSITI